MTGVLRVRREDATFWLMDLADLRFGSKLSFNPSLALVRKYGDRRALGVDFPEDFPASMRFTFAISLLFGDGSTVGLFELASEDEEE
jgi:hypothetical protein